MFATLAHWAGGPSSPLPVVGASGAISGVLGCYFVWFPRNIVRLLWLIPPFIGHVVEVREAVERVLDSQRFVLGDEVRKLEASIATYTQTKHAIACASGSDALLLALMALDVGDGDEVITTPFSFFATAAAITRLGARPVFVDIDPSYYNLDASQVADAITDKTKALLPVHLYGQCAEMDVILELGEQHGIPISGRGHSQTANVATPMAGKETVGGGAISRRRCGPVPRRDVRWRGRLRRDLWNRRE